MRLDLLLLLLQLSPQLQQLVLEPFSIGSSPEVGIPLNVLFALVNLVLSGHVSEGYAVPRLPDSLYAATTAGGDTDKHKSTDISSVRRRPQVDYRLSMKG